MGHCTGSPNKMDHGSPAKNHHYGMRKGESIKQERKKLNARYANSKRCYGWKILDV